MAATKNAKLSGNNLMAVMLLITLLVMGISGLAVKTLFESIALDTKVLEAKGKADKQLTENLKAAPQLVSSYESLGAESQILANSLPDTVDLPSLIIMIENMGNAAGVKVKTIAPLIVGTDLVATDGNADTSSAPLTPQVYQFSVTLDGNYDALKKFLASLETSSRPMRLVGMQLNGTSNALSSEVSIETFYQEKAKLPFGKETVK